MQKKFKQNQDDVAAISFDKGNIDIDTELNFAYLTAKR
ncbi:hypothetical protein ACVW0P_004292 [Mucilaginibacter sp. UYNi724]